MAWSPLDLPTLLIWLDSSDLSSLTLVGSHVSSMSDKSGSGQAWTQGTDANRPISGSLTINGLNVLSYNGTSHQLQRASTLSLGPSLTCVSVAYSNTTAGFNRGILAADSGSGSARILQHRWNTYTAPNSIGFNSGASAAEQATGSGSDCRNAHVFTSVLDNTGHTVTNYIDGTQNGQLTSAPTLNTATVQPAVGLSAYSYASNFWSGGIGEIVICSTALSTSDRQALERYLAAKWGTFYPAGTVTGASTSTGAEAGVSVRLGTVTGTATASGSEAGRSVRHGTTAGANTASGTEAGTRASRGTVTGAAVSAGSETGVARFAGTVSGFATASGAEIGRSVRSGTTSGASTAAGAVSGTVGFAGFVFSGTVTGTTTSTGSVVGVAARSWLGTGRGPSIEVRSCVPSISGIRSVAPTLAVRNAAPVVAEVR